TDQDLLDGDHDLGFVREVGQQQHETVAADPRQGVARRQAGGQPLGQLDQQLVAEAVAQSGVDDAEAINADGDDRQQRTTVSVGGGGLGEAFQQQGAVGGLGQRIVIGQIQQ